MTRKRARSPSPPPAATSTDVQASQGDGASGADSTSDGGAKKQKKSGKKKLEHVYSVEERQLHKCIRNAYAGGACLAEHAPQCHGHKKNSCNYRWQGVKATLDRHTDVFHVRSDALAPRGSQGEQVETSAYPLTSDPSKFCPGHYATRLNLPAHAGDWHINGPHRPGNMPKLKAAGGKDIPNGKNFTADTWPYWNNAHHLIPKGMFNSTIATSEYAEVIRRALLEAEYNIHHHVNMLLMPQDKEVAKLLDLPRHLRLKGNGKLDHPKYNNLVKRRLKKTLRDFEQACKPPEGVKHEDFNVALSKSQLEKLSNDCRATIIKPGPGMSGKPLDNLVSFNSNNSAASGPLVQSV